MLPLTFNTNIVLSVPATWKDWKPWSHCSVSCGAGGSRHRSRGVTPGRHNLCNKANLKPDQGDSEETQMCSTETIPDWPTCPIPARIGSWESWSCSQTCYNEGSPIPWTRTRRRECIEATLSTNTDFNTNIVTCNDLQLSELSETKPCGILPLCSGEDTRCLLLPALVHKCPEIVQIMFFKLCCNPKN